MVNVLKLRCTGVIRRKVYLRRDRPLIEAMAIHSLVVRLSSLGDLDRLPAIIGGAADVVAFVIEEDILEAVGAYELLDLAEEAGVKTSSIRVLGEISSVEALEKLALMSSETLQRTAVIEYTPRLDLDKLFDTFAVNKARVLLDAPPARVDEAYGRVREYIGGVVGLSLSEHKFAGTEDFIAKLDRYLRVVRSVSLTNIDEEGRGVPLLRPSRFNNPAVIRFLIERGYDEEISIDVHGPSAADEYRAFREYARSIEEKVRGRSPFLLRRGGVHL